MGSFTSSILPDYDIVETFSKGLESEIFVVKGKDNELKLIKTISKNNIDNNTIKLFINQVTQINKLNNTNIMKYCEVNESKFFICMIMRQYDYSLLKVDNPVEFFKHNKFMIINNICNGIMAIHNEGLYHGNLKPSNILFNSLNDDYIVSDYLRYDLNINTSSGIPINLENISYIPPEILSNKEIGKASDIWCIGCLCYYIIIGRNIFEGKTVIEIGNKILKCEYEIPNNFEDLKMILSKTLNVNIKERINIENLTLLIEDLKLKELPILPNIGDERVDLPTFIYSKLSNEKKDIIDKIVIDYKNKEKIELNFSDSIKTKNNIYNKIDDIGDNGVEYICYQLNTLKHIKELNLNLCKINNNGFKCLSNHFQYIPVLESLWIGSNNISDEGVKYFSENCKYMQYLKKLGLGRGYILGDCLKQCSKLKVLWINENAMDEKEKVEKKIKENHPNKLLFISI